VGTAGTASVAVTGLVYGNAKQLGLQALALGFIIVYDAVATFVVIKLVGLIVPLRMTDRELELEISCSTARWRSTWSHLRRSWRSTDT